MQQQQTRVTKIRAPWMEIARPGFTPTIVESPVNIFKQIVNAQSYNENRISWSFRSPSTNLLCSPLILGKFWLKIKCPYKLSKHEQVGPLLGVYDPSITSASAALSAVARNAGGKTKSAQNGYGYRPLLSFSSGNAVMNACESKTISVNGGVWTELNSNLFNRSLDECFVPARQMQKSWSTCGGSKNNNDSVPISGHVLGLSDNIVYGRSNVDLATIAMVGAEQDAVLMQPHVDVLNNGYRPIEGASMDSGLKKRMDNLYDQIVTSVIKGAGAELHEYDVEVKFPISGSVFNDVWAGSGLARTDPRLRLPFGIPHVNQCQITLAFKDLLKTVIRRLGRPDKVAGAVQNNTSVSQFNTDDIQISFLDKAPVLEATYIRLPAYRRMPSQEQGGAALQTYRRVVRKPQGTRAGGAYGGYAFNGGLFSKTDTGDKFGLRCGGDFSCTDSVSLIRPSTREFAGSIEVNYVGQQFSQPPSMLFFVYQKDPQFTTHNPLTQQGVGYSSRVPATRFQRGALDRFANEGQVDADLKTAIRAGANGKEDMALAARNIAMAQDSNAAILQFKMTVQSAVGSFAYGDTEEPYLQDRDDLWRKHLYNCHSEYGTAGRQVWQDRESCLLLSASDWLLGMGTSPGTQFPVTIDCTIRYANRAAYSGGACYSVGQGSRGQMVFEDAIIGEPVMVACFDSQILSIGESSAVLSAQVFSQQTVSANLQS